MARLEELGYVDDARYAVWFVTSVAATRAWGRLRVAQELARRGVARGAIDAALARAAEEGAAPEGGIGKALAKLLRARGAPADRGARERLKAALSRRGFAPDEIRKALGSIASPGADEDDAAVEGEDES